MTLKTSKLIDIRFSEVDSMNVVWHGHYPLYFEDAREAFGVEFDLGYKRYMENNCYAPIVEMDFQFKHPLKYGMRPRIDIIYRPTEAAKIVFDYEIHDAESDLLIATGHTVQVFMDLDYQLMWYAPEFFEQWKKRWGV